MKVNAKDVPTADDNATESASEKLESLIVRWLGGRVWLKNSRIEVYRGHRHLISFSSLPSCVSTKQLELGNSFS